jgi:hypothetical protein
MRLRELTEEGTQLARAPILEHDFRPGRTTIILVREPIGVRAPAGVAASSPDRPAAALASHTSRP